MSESVRPPWFIPHYVKTLTGLPKILQHIINYTFSFSFDVINKAFVELTHHDSSPFSSIWKLKNRKNVLTHCRKYSVQTQNSPSFPSPGLRIANWLNLLCFPMQFFTETADEQRQLSDRSSYPQFSARYQQTLQVRIWQVIMGDKRNALMMSNSYWN